MLHRDRVRVRILRYDRKGRPEGRVLDILERRKTPIIGRLLHEGGHWVVAPEDRRYGQDILIPKNATASAAVGQVVSVELTEPPSLHSQPVGRVAEVLGEIDDPGMEIEIAVRKYEVPHRFSPETLAQAAALPDKLRPVDRKHRVDLTDVPLVTIDGEDARDFDDAVYCEPFKRGRGKTPFEGWRLMVAIADVSHYVKPGEPIDDDAYERATSVYFPRRVIPMLPEKLSNGLCSLNPEQDRLAMVCDMLVDSDGAIDAYQFYPAVICSHARLTYTEVAAMLANTRGPEAQKRADLVPHLLHLHEVYRALLKQRAQRGAVDFETTETQIVCDENGRIEKIVPRTRTEAHRLIEEAMLAANVCAADFIAAAEHPALFRVHEGPTPEKRRDAAELPAGAGHRPAPQRRPDAGRDAGHRAGHARTGPTRRRSTPCCCARCSRRSTPPPTPATSAWPTTPTRTSPARSGATPTCWCTASSRRCSASKRYHLVPQRAHARAAGAARRGGKAGAPAGQAADAGAGALGGRRARTAAPTSAAPTRPRATSRPGSSAATCASTWARSSPARSARSPASASSSRSTRCTSKAWCTSPNSAASTTASTRRARNCAASAPASATPWARACACRSAASTWTAARSTSAWCAKARASGRALRAATSARAPTCQRRWTNCRRCGPPTAPARRRRGARRQGRGRRAAFAQDGDAHRPGRRRAARPA